MKLVHGCALLMLVTLAATAAAADNSRPNILYIFADDLSYRAISAYPEAYPFVDTPNIDRIAETGVRFEQAYIGAKCAPSRVGQRTGRFQYATKLPGIDPATAAGNWYKDLRANGYYNGMTGKWHWGDGPESIGHGVSWDWSVVWDHGNKDSGGYYEGTMVRINGADPVPLGGYSTDRYSELTVEFIKERAAEKNKPWFFWLCYGGVHSPYTPPPRHLQLYLDQPPTPMPVDVFGPRPNMPSHMQDFSSWTEENGEVLYKGKPHDFWVKQQMQAVRAIDDGVGTILKALEETGQLENTIVIFTTDQGYVWGEHGLKGKIWPYAAAIKSPLLISNPKRFPAGKVCPAPVSGMDMVATFHALSGTEATMPLHGRDITPLLKQPESKSVADEWNKTPTMMCYMYNRYEATEMAEKLKNNEWGSFCWTDPGNKGKKKKKKKANKNISETLVEDVVDLDGVDGAAADPTSETGHPNWFSLNDGQYKYIRYCYPDRIEELYDVRNDPDELNNLAVNQANEAILQKFRAALVTQLKAKNGEAFADLLPAPAERWNE